MTNRRHFLWSCSALTLTASLAPAAIWSNRSTATAVTLAQLRFADFFHQVGTSFRVGEPNVTLQLMEAKRLPIYPLAQAAKDARNEKFSLLFSGPQAAALKQNTHRFEHAQLGAFDMFIVPVGYQDSNRVYYQAVFNRPTRATLESLT